MTNDLDEPSQRNRQYAQNRRILAIDDNRAIHDDLRKILAVGSSDSDELDRAASELFGSPRAPAPVPFEIDSACSGIEGLELLCRRRDEGRPHALAFVDICMPSGWDGIETIVRLWQEVPDLEVVICTAYSKYSWQETRQRIAHPERWLVLKKPFDSIEVQQLASALTEKWSLRKQARCAIAELEGRVASRTEELRTMIRATSDAVWDWDLATDKMVWNERAGVIFGYPIEEIGTDAQWWRDRIHCDDRVRVLGSVQAVVGGNAADWNDQYRYRRADDSYADVLARGRLLRDPAGKPVRLIGALIDVTERNQMQRRLVLSERMASMGTMAAGVAHEINNPLTYVTTNLEFAIDHLSHAPSGTSDTPKVLEALREAGQGAERVRAVVGDLKKLSRSGETCGAVDLLPVIESCLGMAQNEIRHRAQVVRQFSHAPKVFANEARLGQVFLNLLINAAQSIETGAAGRNVIRIRIATDERGRALVDIEDSGSGMSPEALSRIFDPFFTTKPLGEGTGLGLSICHGIVTELGGEIQVWSELARGSTFRVLLPPVSTEALGETGPKGEALVPIGRQAAARRGRILVVDDEPLVIRTIERILGRDHDLTTFTSASRALEAIAGGAEVDLVLCDLMMPEVTGMDFHERLGLIRQSLLSRIVFLSGGAFTDGARRFLERSLNRCLDKPFRSQDLRSLVHGLLAG